MAQGCSCGNSRSGNSAGLYLGKRRREQFQVFFIDIKNYNGRQLDIGDFKSPADIYVYEDSYVFVLDNGLFNCSINCFIRNSPIEDAIVGRISAQYVLMMCSFAITIYLGSSIFISCCLPHNCHDACRNSKGGLSL